MRPRLAIPLSQVVIPATIVILMSIGPGCASPHLTNMWRDPEFKGPSMTNMLIIAANKSPVNRRIWEDEIVAKLSAQGVASTPSYRLYSDSIPDPDQVRVAVREKKIDGVLLIKRLPTEISTNYIPGPVKSEQVSEYDQRTQTYLTVYRDVQQPGYTDTNRVVRHEVVVFTTEGEAGHLVWAGTGEMINPGSREAVRNEITALVIPELGRQGIIPTSK